MASTFDPAVFADQIAEMTDDELFEVLHDLERQSEARAVETKEEALGRIRLVEEAIERRYPGQALAPYKQWQRRNR